MALVISARHDHLSLPRAPPNAARVTYTYTLACLLMIRMEPITWYGPSAAELGDVDLG